MAFAPGTTDLETNDSIKLALEVDPEGKRTLAVVTKMDMIGAGKFLSSNISVTEPIPHTQCLVS